MIIDHRSMLWRACFSKFMFLAVMAAGCQEPNPRSCLDGTCTDPTLPFCDVDGALAGEPQTCIAVTCTPGEFEACRGDQALTCNTEGTSYDLIQCPKGCDGLGGCRVCEPNQTVCANGKVQTCDANGAVIESEDCPLGCFEDEPRCRNVQSSNNLDAYLDMVSDPPDLDLQNPTFQTDTGVVTTGQTVVQIPSFLVSPVGNGASIRVFVVNSLRLTSAKVLVSGDPRLAPGPALAILSLGDVELAGEILVHQRVGSAINGCRPAGAGNSKEFTTTRAALGGGGGGGNGTGGGAGGRVFYEDTTTAWSGGVGDFVSGTDELIPLRGGCSGGCADTITSGGGAVQITSGTEIRVNAKVDAKGAEGYSDRNGQSDAFFVCGGGGGGSLLLEAPQITLGPEAKLLLPGGDGAQACAAPTTYCGARGTGATSTAAATAGMDVPFAPTSMTNVVMNGGAGGGGLGRVRINTADGTYSKSSSAEESAAITTGTVRTR